MKQKISSTGGVVEALSRRIRDLLGARQFHRPIRGGIICYWATSHDKTGFSPISQICTNGTRNAHSGTSRSSEGSQLHRVGGCGTKSRGLNLYGQWLTYRTKGNKRKDAVKQMWSFRIREAKQKING
ncbi:uncharacterized protein PADG_01491 [Paracoccidioides brasiliensis Pb18]|uniref:Uncharacterized protein n=1 Tax=Paracoccidioides brasiliensis (strain Pb18) TaxID=502780 RepID=C1G3H5_PARBD|nr:uncharacterized protein PADG_01491 [Paracoccidioides brasiliensis Pb18]EEH45341.2 hypothetical protein PADG_01491 [Paracoccidioides brasiliensis Pb18]